MCLSVLQNSINYKLIQDDIKYLSLHYSIVESLHQNNLWQGKTRTLIPQGSYYFCLVPVVGLRTGGVDFKNYLKALEEIGYRGFLTIERECGANPAGDIEIAANYLRKIIREN